MGVNWSLLQPVDIGGMFQQGYERGQQMVQQARTKSALAAFGADPTNPEAQSALAQASPEFAMKLASHKWELAQKEAERARLGAYFSQADPTIARKQALASGDIDVAKQLGDLDEETRKRAVEEAKGAAPILYEAQKLPYEQRKDFLRSQAAALSRVGFTPDEIEAYDPTDTNNAGILSIARTLDQAQDRDKWSWIQNPDGSRFAVDSFGRPVGDPTGGSGRSVTPSPAGAAPGGGEFQFTPVAGAHPTSGYRSAADNKRVGGVANSYHLTDQARDFTPPPGMSMGELHAKLSAANPHLQVINEGDHVHIEPKSRDQFAAGGAQGGTGDQKLQLIQQAREAIAAGAPEAAVRERLAKMGVSL